MRERKNYCLHDHHLHFAFFPLLLQTADLTEPQKTFTNCEIDALEMRYYTTAIHRAAFVLPRFIEKELYK